MGDTARLSPVHSDTEPWAPEQRQPSCVSGRGTTRESDSPPGVLESSMPRAPGGQRCEQGSPHGPFAVCPELLGSRRWAGHGSPQGMIKPGGAADPQGRLSVNILSQPRILPPCHLPRGGAGCAYSPAPDNCSCSTCPAPGQPPVPQEPLLPSPVVIPHLICGILALVLQC